MKKIFIIILVLSIKITAIGQNNNILIWKSDTLNLYSNPLELRTDWKKLEETISIKIEKTLPFKNKDSVYEVLIWGNYETEWQINENKLYLSGIISLEKPFNRINIQEVFHSKEKRIFADWVNDELILFNGKCIICTGNHARNTSIYENETSITFKKGILKSLENHKNHIERKSQFRVNSNPNEYLNFIYSNINWNALPEMGNEYFQVVVSINPNKKGLLKSIDWENTYLINGNNIIQNKKNIFIKEAVRIAKIIPDWNVIIRQGKIERESLVIIFNKEQKTKY